MIDIYHICNLGYGRRVLKGMLNEAQDGLAKGTNVANLMTRQMAEQNAGELQARLRQRKQQA